MLSAWKHSERAHPKVIVVCADGGTKSRYRGGVATPHAAFTVSVLVGRANFNGERDIKILSLILLVGGERNE
jgi:hypothetical protein